MGMGEGIMGIMEMSSGRVVTGSKYRRGLKSSKIVGYVFDSFYETLNVNETRAA
jgi:hypothetical protein